MSEITVEDRIFTTDWPTEPGWYWFYGWRFGIGVGDSRPTLHIVQVKTAGGGIHRIIGGTFMYQQEGHKGIFTPMENITLPSWSDVEIMALQEVTDE